MKACSGRFALSSSAAQSRAKVGCVQRLGRQHVDRFIVACRRYRDLWPLSRSVAAQHCSGWKPTSNGYFIGQTLLT
jgi:hypothetical protein